LAGAWLVIWLAVILVLPPEPAAFLEVIRRVPEQKRADGGMTFNLRMVADGPEFILLDRGLGTPENFIPSSLPVIWCWPALRLASTLAPTFGVREVNASAFILFLVVQWTIVGVVIRSGCRVLGSMALGVRGRRTRG